MAHLVPHGGKGAGLPSLTWSGSPRACMEQGHSLRWAPGLLRAHPSRYVGGRTPRCPHMPTWPQVTQVAGVATRVLGTLPFRRGFW